ncbi:type I-E CRISPR-associated endoribonuclease Cas2e [Actinokineospora globicatena]|uniref:type I-E CRISPR-associated endoribonuclease Cas2e n=1 Tax=Actinokineospora globicatena TaxID=103729 RepID=UPI002552C7D8|nr:type I-E CRISPR-associated endoribonuclease Cas2e [Actinokineospora globicatena]
MNKALSAANTSLYGVVHAVVVALGLSPGLGFVHTGHIRSFVYDIADLYKADLTIPIAFDIAARLPSDIASETRRAIRDSMKDGKFLETCVQDITSLLSDEDEVIEYGPDALEAPRRCHALGLQRPRRPRRNLVRRGRPVTIIVVTACPPGLRGHLTRWLLEISPGVFVGTITTRVRILMWQRVTDMAKTGRAIMVYSTNTEQGLAFEVHNHDWTPIDHEGLHLIRRPNPNTSLPITGWSNAARRRRQR